MALPRTCTQDDRRAQARMPCMLWVIHGDEAYGVRRATLGMAQCLSATGAAIAFAAMRSGAFSEEIERKGYPLVILGRRRVAGLDGRGVRYLRSVARLFLDAAATSAGLRKTVRSLRPQWIHIRSNSLLVSTALAARATSTPLYWHLPNTIRSKLPFGLQAMGYRLLCRVLRVRALANSRHTARSLAPARRGASRVLYPGVDTEFFSPSANFRRIQREDLAIEPRLPLFLIAARVIPDKAQDRVIEAVLALARARLSLALIIVGGPTESSFFRLLEVRIRSAGASGFIRLLGSTDDPRPYYNVCDVVVNSRVKAEPFGLSIIEAMLMRRPVLAYALGGPSETILDGETGWLFDDPSPEGYAQGLRRALADRHRWTAMGTRARQHAVERFSLRRSCSEYIRLVGSDRVSTRNQA